MEVRVAVAGELQDVVVRQSEYLRHLLRQPVLDLSYPFPYSGSEDELVQVKCVALDIRNQLAALKHAAVQNNCAWDAPGSLSHMALDKDCQISATETGMLEKQVREFLRISFYRIAML